MTRLHIDQAYTLFNRRAGACVGLQQFAPPRRARHLNPPHLERAPQVQSAVLKALGIGGTI